MADTDPFQKVRDLLMKDLDDPTDELMILGLSALLMLAANFIAEYVPVRLAVVVLIVSVLTGSLVFFGSARSKPLRLVSWGLCSIVLFSQVTGLATTAFHLGRYNVEDGEDIIRQSSSEKHNGSQFERFASGFLDQSISKANADSGESLHNLKKELERLKQENEKLKRETTSSKSDVSRNEEKQKIKKKGFFKPF